MNDDTLAPATPRWPAWLRRGLVVSAVVLGCSAAALLYGNPHVQRLLAEQLWVCF